MHSTSTPQSLLTLFSTLPQSQMQPELETSSPDDSQGFSSILGTLLPNSALPQEGISKLQVLPLANQSLPLAEFDLAQLPNESSMPMDVVTDNLPMENLWEQFNFGPIGVVKAAVTSSNEPIADSDEQMLELELSEQEAALDPLALVAAETETALPPLQPLAQVIAQAHSTDDSGANVLSARPLQRIPEQAADANAQTLAANLAAGADAENGAEFNADLGAELNSSAGQFYVAEQVDGAEPDLDLALNNSRVTTTLEPGVLPQPVTNAGQFQLQVNTFTETAATVAAQKGSELNAESLQTQLLREKLEFGQDRQQWGAALGSRIMTMIADDIQQARIHLDPPELGSLEIKLQIQQDQATVHVQAQNAQVRDVLEAHAQRLRDALASQGIALSEFDVSERGAEQQQQSQSETAQTAEAANGEWLAADDQASDNELRPASSMNLLDTFA